MKFINCYVITFLLIACLIFIGCDTKDNTDTKTFENITIQEAVELIEDNTNNTSFTILDVRTPEEFNAGYIEGAMNLDFYSNTFNEELNKLEKDNTYFIYCGSGNRSGQAMTIMKFLGFEEGYNLSVGIIDWISEGLPVVN